VRTEAAEERGSMESSSMVDGDGGLPRGGLHGVLIPISHPARVVVDFSSRIGCVFFIFTFFFKKLQKYILVFKIYSAIPLPPGRGAAGALPPPCWAVGTSLQIKIKFICE